MWHWLHDGDGWFYDHVDALEGVLRVEVIDIGHHDLEEISDGVRMRSIGLMHDWRGSVHERDEGHRVVAGEEKR